METTKKDLVVGVGLQWAATEISEGRMAYERVQAVYYYGTNQLDDKAIAAWIRGWLESLDNPKTAKWAAVVRRLWSENKVLQPRLLGMKVKEHGHWIKWSEFSGGNDERPGEGGS